LYWVCSPDQQSIVSNLDIDNTKLKVGRAFVSSTRRCWTHFCWCSCKDDICSKCWSGGKYYKFACRIGWFIERAFKRYL